MTANKICLKSGKRRHHKYHEAERASLFTASFHLSLVSQLSSDNVGAGGARGRETPRAESESWLAN
jgi:hypothetical protein